jgi:diacylglycerol O-acyltransferase
MFLAGAEMVETYPVPPLHPGFGVAIGVTSYDGGVYYGITADRDALPDIDILGQCVTEALDELVESSSDSRQRARRGLKKPKATS